MYKIGDIIKTYRIKQRITQEKLADGICTIGNLSRMENNQQIPSKSIFEALMQKLDQPYDVYPVIISEEEEITYQLRYEIKNCIKDQDYIKAGRLLDELMKRKKLDHLYRQFILYAKTILMEEISGNTNDVILGYQQALKMTLKDFRTKNILSYLLTVEEITLIHRIAKSNYKLNNKKEAIQIAYAMIEYFKNKIILLKDNVDMYLLIDNDLAEWLYDAGNYTESIKVCDNRVDIEEILPDEYAKLFATVFQDFSIFKFRILDNLIFDEDSEPERLEKAWKALDDIGLANVIKALPKGINSYITQTFSPDGIDLSGGELQKLAIARNLYKNAPIMILDEPTSALSPQSEYEIYTSFNVLTQS